MSKKPEPGDEAWMVRLGSEPRVIFAHARVLSKPSPDSHWDERRAAAGDEATYITIQVDDMRDPFGDGAIPVSQLTGVGSTQNWTPQQSGIEIKPEATAVLRDLWNRRATNVSSERRQIFVFTAGNQDARAHLRDSIEGAVPLEKAVASFPAEEHERLKRIEAEAEGLYAWGAIPGPQNTPRWNQMGPGDWVLCVYDHTYHFVAQVLARYESERFARAVWGEDQNGRTWSLMYFLTRPTKVAIPVAGLAEYLNASYMGFFRIGDERLEKIVRDFGSVDRFVQTRLLDKFIDIPDGITRDDVLNALRAIDGGEGEEFGESTGYDLVHDQRRYAPKRVIGLAARRVLGRSLKPSEFTGGEDSKCFRVLRRLGFEIVPKAAAEPASYFLIRLNAESPYADELGKNYHFTGTVPNCLKLKNGGQVVVDRKSENGPLLIGYGTLGVADQKVEGDERHYNARFLSWTPFEQPLHTPKDAIEELESTEGYNKQHAIRPIGESIYRRLTRREGPRTMDLKAAVESFSKNLRNCHVSYGRQHDALVRSFVCSLAAKPLAILTGLSGSGKTQIAIRFGEWLGEGRLLVSAVRPDWTGAEAIFGYEDALKPAPQGNPGWTVPEPLAFLLRAAGDPDSPYALVLDEMNLSHVERYFADVLSGMESRQPCLPNLERGSDGVWRRRVNAPPYIPFPRNVYIIGTVNVDETTYMFSPKVLDRANTFEFRVSTGDLTSNGRKPIACAPGEPALVRGFLDITRNENWHLESDFTLRDELEAKLRVLHQLLSNHDLEFGHRVFHEALRFAALHEVSGDTSLSQILDRIVMQKILPRSHGSRRRLESPLLGLAHFCFYLSNEIAGESETAKLKIEELSSEQAKLPLSFEKARRMIRNLRANQFASFTE